jgi:hypothetical protein
VVDRTGLDVVSFGGVSWRRLQDSPRRALHRLHGHSRREQSGSARPDPNFRRRSTGMVFVARLGDAARSALRACHAGKGAALAKTFLGLSRESKSDR